MSRELLVRVRRKLLCIDIRQIQTGLSRDLPIQAKSPEKSGICPIDAVEFGAVEARADRTVQIAQQLVPGARRDIGLDLVGRTGDIGLLQLALGVQPQAKAPARRPGQPDLGREIGGVVKLRVLELAEDETDAGTAGDQPAQLEFEPGQCLDPLAVAVDTEIVDRIVAADS